MRDPNQDDDALPDEGTDGDRILSIGGRLLALVGLAAMLGVGGVALSREDEVRRARLASSVPPVEAKAALKQDWARASDIASPRAAMLRALVEARAAFVEPDLGERARLIAAARRDIAAAVAVRPIWGEADVVRTYIELVAGGAASAGARAAFATSYRSAPFLEDSALWRVTYGGNQWSALDAATRDHVIEEALWYRYRSRAKDVVLLPALGGGEPEQRYRAAIKAAAAPGPLDRPPQF